MQVRRDFEMFCLVYSWLISMQKWAYYRRDVRKTPYFIMHRVIKKNETIMKIKVYILD